MAPNISANIQAPYISANIQAPYISASIQLLKFVHLCKRYCFPLRSYQKKDLFFFYVIYFLLYNPNLKSVFCGRTYKYVLFFLCFLMSFWFVCLVRLGYFRLGYFRLIDWPCSYGDEQK